MGVISCARATNEDNYAAQKFARAVLGTHNIDHCARICHSPSVAGLSLTLGSGAMTASITDIDRADLILLIGADCTENHAIIGALARAGLACGAAADNLWLSVERRMHCAVGLCGHCYIADSYACVDGPTYRYDNYRELLAAGNGRCPPGEHGLGPCGWRPAARLHGQPGGGVTCPCRA